MRTKIVALFVLYAAVNSLDETAEDFRKHYGLGFNNRCRSYQRVFKCMTSCKAMNFQVFRLNHRCRCTCHETKTTTILPFFKWRTNGTTRAIPPTFSVSLYHIVGTLSPGPTPTTPKPNVTTHPTCEDVTKDTTDSGTVFNTTDSNSTDVFTTTQAEGTDTNATEEVTPEGGGDDATEAEGNEGGTEETETKEPEEPAPEEPEEPA